MPRLARTVIENVPCHITQRGNHRQDVFYTIDDRTRYLEMLSQYASRYSLDIAAYCLMTNHIHVVAIPRKSDSMSRTIQTVQMRHTQSINRERKWSGHLWHSRYFSTPLDDRYFVQAIRYVGQNPVRAGLVRSAVEYPWSSAAFHCGMPDQTGILRIEKGYEMIFDGWESFLKELTDETVIETLRRRTMTGIPCGDEKFMRRISKLIGREIIEKRRGGYRKPVK
jgi:putative transposase